MEEFFIRAESESSTKSTSKKNKKIFEIEKIIKESQLLVKKRKLLWTTSEDLM